MFEISSHTSPLMTSWLADTHCCGWGRYEAGRELASGIPAKQNQMQRMAKAKKSASEDIMFSNVAGGSRAARLLTARTLPIAAYEVTRLTSTAVSKLQQWAVRLRHKEHQAVSRSATLLQHGDPAGAYAIAASAGGRRSAGPAPSNQESASPSAG